MFNLSLILEDSARRFANQPALSFNKTTLTYAELNNFANRVANGLKAIGILPGDKIALSCPNLPEFPAVYFGVLKAGAVIVPLNILLKADEILYHLNDSKAKAYFCFSGSEDLPIGDYGLEAFYNAPLCEHFYIINPQTKEEIYTVKSLNDLADRQPSTFQTEETSADDVALLIYTSGTTGQAKGAQLSHSNLFCNAVLATDLFTTSHRDKQLVVLPLFHIFGMTVLMNAGIYRGVHNILLPRFDPKAVLELIDAFHISIFAGVPTMYWALINYHHESIEDACIKKNLRLCISGGASLPLKVLQDFEKRFNVWVLEGYGMSEGSPIVTFNDLRIGCKPGSIGTAVWGVEVKIVDATGKELPDGERGELIYRGHNVMKGYFEKPRETADVIKNGWMYSGDVAVKDKDGFYYIVDRTRDMIIRGGMNIFPREIEEIMMKHPSISLVAVIGIPDERMGEDVKAFIVLKAHVKANAEEIILWCKAHMAVYKYPRKVEFVESLPISATGKILKKELRMKSAI
ncbi:long-chain fatty acid--CoA ligase [Pedobacter sp. ISL-68]|uniref:long-chain-fatty-acid--CoA ligase n=1 Tax=unclassified Pedobacter TaxID=2628915 RepID=UPI001BEAFCF0|nr:MULTISPECIES: long-chain fatty acid--CoA ligase [unclassified Pedobacter]MBT2563129.1 long-chain fatty acid--CoA ligase [Pedobacter sp. ISL-64]MBT2593467.1 long-chain fatty acid--CoA ligase [Pedobacter sp. ISL-68]